MRELIDAGCSVKVAGGDSGEKNHLAAQRTPSVGAATPRARVSDPKGQLAPTPQSLRVNKIRPSFDLVVTNLTFRFLVGTRGGDAQETFPFC